MALSDAHADAVATLLNSRNQLTVQYTRQRVLQEADNYLYRLDEAGQLIACVELEKVQWYQAEVPHLTVAEAHEGKGHAKALLCDAECAARTKGVKLLQCTIRTDNDASRGLFEGFGFSHVGTFRNEVSGNNVGIFQKVLATAR